MEIRPCEQTYILNTQIITPDDINDLASRNNFMYWVCDNEGKVSLEEIHSIATAVRDNWKRFIASA